MSGYRWGNRTRGSRARKAAIGFGAVLLIAGCADESSDSSADGSAEAEDLTFGLVTQLSVADYFATQADGAEAKAEELGVELQVADGGIDVSEQLTQSQNLITAGVDALAIVPSNTDIGPRATALTDDAGIPLVASDSPLEDSDGNPVPFVGLDNVGSGEQVGEIAAREFQNRGWAVEDTYYAVVEASELQACVQRTNAALEVFGEQVTDFPEDQAVTVPYDGTPGDATNSMRAAITANPEAQHWVITACNDDGVVGTLRALNSSGAEASDQLGVGLGGNLACQVYADSYLAEGMPISTYLDPAAIGATVVETMKDLAEGEDVPEQVFVDTPEITAENYQEVVGC